MSVSEVDLLERLRRPFQDPHRKLRQHHPLYVVCHSCLHVSTTCTVGEVVRYSGSFCICMSDFS
jgi:hypothetical protein